MIIITIIYHANTGSRILGAIQGGQARTRTCEDARKGAGKTNPYPDAGI
jgi:hypothetical protein